MIKTAIITETEGNFPKWYKNDGFAKDLKVADWLFTYCGWNLLDGYPQLVVCIEVIDWREGDKYFTSNTTELFILGDRMILN